MLKVTLRTNDGRAILILGVSKVNAERLLRGAPITFTGEEVGIPALAEVLIVGGETNVELIRPLVERGMVPADVLEHARRTDEEPGYQFRRGGGH